jgi:hypothetical protein
MPLGRGRRKSILLCQQAGRAGAETCPSQYHCSLRWVPLTARAPHSRRLKKLKFSEENMMAGTDQPWIFPGVE